MNILSKFSRAIAFSAGLGAALALAACGELPAGEEAYGPSADGVDLRGSTIGGEFELTSNKGEKVKWSDFDGQYRLI